jgi:hypothetical protein
MNRFGTGAEEIHLDRRFCVVSYLTDPRFTRIIGASAAVGEDLRQWQDHR